jgi:hypothetical protein
MVELKVMATLMGIMKRKRRMNRKLMSRLNMLKNMLKKMRKSKWSKLST